MNLSGDVEIIVDVDNEDNNYCDESCIYFMPNICDLPHITGGSDYKHKYDDKIGKYHRTDTCIELTEGKLSGKNKVY